MRRLVAILCLLLVSGAARANDKVIVGLDWKAEAEYGGYYQVVATGICAKHGLEVTIQQGGPQVNHTQLLLAGRLVDRLTALGQGLHPKDRLYPKDRNVTKAYMVQSINYTVGMDLTH